MIRRATKQDAHALARRVRLEDRREIAAASGASPLKALLAGISHSADARALDNQGVQALFGVVETGRGEGGIWLVGSPAIAGRARWEFARASRRQINDFQRRWPRLHGRAHADNAVHLRWLRWCGFSLSDPEPWGVTGDLFHQFERVAHV